MNRLALFLTLLVLPTLAAAARAAVPTSTSLVAPDGSEVTIHRDAWGVPHIYGTSETGVFYAQGYAAAADRLWQMEIFRRAATGRLSELRPTPENQRTDALVEAVFYTEAERAALFGDLPPAVQNLYTAYVAGVNAYLGAALQDPALLPAQLAALYAAGVPPEFWTVDQAVAVTQFFMRRFGAYGGEELDRYLECVLLGPDFTRAFYPLNDPSAPTTIPDGALAPPAGYGATDALADGGGCPSYTLPAPGKRAASATSTPDPVALRPLLGLGDAVAGGPIEVDGVRVPEKLGSFGVSVSSAYTATGSVMLFGAPQLGPPLPPAEPFITGSTTGLTVPHEVELWDRGGDLHVGGMAIAGIPGVIIGRTLAHTWSLTSGNTDNTDVYLEVIPPSLPPGSYLYNGTAAPFEVLADGEITRSVHGPVVRQIAAGTVPGVSVDLAVALKFSFWKRELAMVTAFYRIWKAADRGAFEDALADVPMSFNVLYADRDGRVGYWHVGRYPDRAGGVDPRFPHLGIGTEEWQGILPFAHLPKLADPPAGFFANWNNKPVGWWLNGDRGNWVTTDTDAFTTSSLPPDLVTLLGLDDADNRAERTIRVTAITDYLSARPDLTYEALKATPLALEDAFGSYSAENLPPALAFLDDLIQGDRGTYQQAIEFLRRPDRGVRVRDENLVPPGQSGFISIQGTLDPHFGDQWPLNVRGELKDMLFGAAFPDRTVPVCGAVSDDGMRMHIADTESGIAGLRFVVPGGTASYRLLDGTTVGPFGHRDRAEVAGYPAELDVEVEGSALRGGRPLVVQVTNGAGATRACVAQPHRAEQAASADRRAQLLSNSPNPFNPSTVIRFEVGEPAPVRLEVYNLLGRKVATLVDAALEAGVHEAMWNGRSDSGGAVAGGVYLYRLTAGDVTATGTMTLLK